MFPTSDRMTCPCRTHPSISLELKAAPSNIDRSHLDLPALQLMTSINPDRRELHDPSSFQTFNLLQNKFTLDK